jgi:hypothetical protein
MPLKDIAGMRFGRLVVQSLDRERTTAAKGTAYWTCACDCGGHTVACGAGLRSGKWRSCGCLCAEAAAARLTVHGGYRDAEYASWESMIARCYNPRRPGYKNWGGRGITVCDRWRASYADFLADVGRRPGLSHSIDRIDNDKGYEPGNVRWATRGEQLRNTRRTRLLASNGDIACIADWSKRLGISKSGIRNRLRRGWTAADAISVPAVALKGQAYRGSGVGDPGRGSIGTDEQRHSHALWRQPNNDRLCSEQKVLEAHLKCQYKTTASS